LPAEQAFPRFEKLEPALRDRILDAAQTEFGRFGFSAASMNRLVKGAGISKGAIFKYFGTKAGLFDYVYRSSLEELKDELRAVRNATRDEPFFSRLEKVFRIGLGFTTRRPMSAAIYYRVIYTGDSPHGKRILSEIQGAARRSLQDLIEEGVKKGELRQDIDTKKSAFIIQSVLDRFLQAHYLDFMVPALDRAACREGSDPSLTSDKWIHEMKNIFQYGLENRPRRGTK